MLLLEGNLPLTSGAPQMIASSCTYLWQSTARGILHPSQTVLTGVKGCRHLCAKAAAAALAAAVPAACEHATHVCLVSLWVY